MSTRVVLLLGALALLLGLASQVTFVSTCGPGRWGRARSRLAMLRAALDMYRADHGGLPRGSPRLDDDDAPWLCAALLFAPEAGGGVRGPYLDWRPSELGVLERGGVDGPAARPLSPAEQARARAPAFQRAHGPETDAPLVLLDGGGRPIHARSWVGVRAADLERLEREPWRRGPFDHQPSRPGAQAPIAHEVVDRPRTEHGWDLWTEGENGVNEYGAACSDDVTSWEPDLREACGCRPAWVPAPGRAGQGLAALAGLGLLGGLGAWRLRGRRSRPVEVRGASPRARCAYCHQDARALLACTRCGTGLHLDCWSDLGRCPTLGCAG